MKKQSGFVVNKADIINLIAVSAVSLVCVIFFIVALNSYRTSAARVCISNLKQIASTDNSILIAWDCSTKAEKYVISYNNGSDDFSIETTLPFARLEKLDNGKSYTVNVKAVKNDIFSNEAAIECKTQPRCDVTDISIISEENRISVSWSFEGVDNGFKVMAYAVDSQGYRHANADSIIVDIGQESICYFDNLLPSMTYTIAVVPQTKYLSLKKMNTEPLKYNKLYNNLNIIQSIICEAKDMQSQKPKSFNSISRGSEYAVSIMVQGEGDADSTADFDIYFINRNGTLVKELKASDVHTNPNNKPSFIYRPIAFSFTCDDMPPDNYNVLVCIDGKTASHFDISIS